MAGWFRKGSVPKDERVEGGNGSIPEWRDDKEKSRSQLTGCEQRAGGMTGQGTKQETAQDRRQDRRFAAQQVPRSKDARPLKITATREICKRSSFEQQQLNSQGLNHGQGA